MISKHFKNTYFLPVFFFFFCLISCGQQISPEAANILTDPIITGAQQTDIYKPLLKGKKIAVVANQTSVVYKGKDWIHLVDSLLKLDLDVKKIFSPEHGFRGQADASELIEDGIDIKTGLPILSLHGKTRKPRSEDLADIDIVVFDIQDVGVRFYTYLSTLHYVMEACAENAIPLIILDRPNPNGHYVDGPVLQDEHKSFLGMHPVPLVYGMTIGEYGKMINGELWLKNEVQCDLTVIPLKNYNHNSPYSLPLRPSPNLPNDLAINLYPSLGFFEGTPINAGRGTEFQFQRYGAPFFPKAEFLYIPESNFGAKYPKHKGQSCFGVDLANIKRLNAIDMQWIIDAYNKTPDSISFFGPTFIAHAGTTLLKDQIQSGLSAKVIRDSWQGNIRNFKKIRSKYLIYD